MLFVITKWQLKKNNNEAMNSYATMLNDGDGVEASQADAARYYKMAADKGNASSMYNYEHLLRNEQKRSNSIL